MKRGGQTIVVAVAVNAGVRPTPAKALRRDRLCEGVQALVNEIRQDLSGSITAGDVWRLQEVADRLEALPGVRPVANWQWRRDKPKMPHMKGYKWPVLRLPSSA